MTFTQSTFESGSYNNGSWRCACNLVPVWRTVKKDGPTQGHRFLRCVAIGNGQCNFFLWEHDESDAEMTMNKRNAPVVPVIPVIPVSSVPTIPRPTTPKTSPIRSRSPSNVTSTTGTLTPGPSQASPKMQPRASFSTQTSGVSSIQSTAEPSQLSSTPPTSQPAQKTTGGFASSAPIPTATTSATGSQTGGAAASIGAFGTRPVTKGTAGFGGFGTLPTAQATGGFGSLPATQTTSAFGTLPATQATTGFGQLPTTQTTSAFGFGAPPAFGATATTQGTSAFGGSKAAGVFGSPPTSQTTNPFGSQSTGPAFGLFGGGTNTQHSPPSRVEFGAKGSKPIKSSQDSAQDSGLFGSSAQSGAQSSTQTLHQPWLPTPDNTPTKPASKQDKGGFNILTQITTRLNDDGVSLKYSTKEYLRHVLRSETAIYEAKLEARDATIARLLRKIDELELKASK